MMKFECVAYVDGAMLAVLTVVEQNMIHPTAIIDGCGAWR